MDLKSARRAVEITLREFPGFLRAGIQMGQRPHVRVEVVPGTDKNKLKAALPAVDVPVQIVTSTVLKAIETH